MIKNNNITDIHAVPANRALIDDLFENDLITRDAHLAALAAIHPHKSWALWIDRLLLAFGAALVLSGIIYFFAFNWAVIPPVAKLSAIQAGLVFCMAGAAWQGLDTITGKSMLTAASVLVGVFMAVFGQIYQTGADAYQLFMMWSLLILPWTLLCGFAAQWMLWLAVTNTFISLWWTQAALPTWEYRDLIFAITGVFNLAALAGRELFARRAAHNPDAWAPPRWSRVLLTATVLGAFIPPMCAFMFDGFGESTGTVISALTGFAVLAGLHTLYRFYITDLWALAVAVLAGCIVTEALMINLLTGGLRIPDAPVLFLMGLLTIGLFAGAMTYLRGLSDMHSTATH